MEHTTHCHAPAQQQVHAGHSHLAGYNGPEPTLRLSIQATLHCLTGCAIGEFIGLAIGVTLELNPFITMALATALGFTSGYLLGLVPLVRQGHGWLQAFRMIWVGETISIAVMELVMNLTDYQVGGMNAASVLHLQFWYGYLLALPAGFLAAWPVNYLLLKRNLKKPCH